MANMLGIDEAVDRANRLARLMDDDAPLGRALPRTARSTGCCGPAASSTS